MMKGYAAILAIAMCTALFVTCKTATMVQLESSADVPALTEQNYKSVNTNDKIVGIYFYNSVLGREHVDNGDMTLKAMKDVLGSRVNFYKIDLRSFSQQEQLHVKDKVLGAPKLPSYVFLYRNNVIAKRLGGHDNRELAAQTAEMLNKGFQEKIWRSK